MICYVILHYKNIKDTRKCIESLKETAAKDSRFIVVDNGSADGSGNILKEEYAANSQVEVLLLDENVGFSKGNNAGYAYALSTYKPDFIVVTNNDVVFWQKDFEKKIYELYDKNGFFVLGPDVFIPRHGDHQSPMFQNAITASRLRNELEEYKFYQANPSKFNKRLKIHAFKNMLCSKSKLVNCLYSKLRGKDLLDYRKQYENVGLQGSCLIFSKDFMDKESKAFDPEPFLYEEEVFLFYRCRKKNYKMLYSPEIAIRHEEAASFHHSQKNNVDRLVFMLKHHVIARQMLLDYLESEEK